MSDERDDFYDGESDDDGFDELACDWIPGTGQCMAAGSEYCDWNCPYHDEYAKESVALAQKAARRKRRSPRP